MELDFDKAFSQIESSFSKGTLPKSEIETVKKGVRSLVIENNLLLEKIRLLQTRQFGKSSESLYSNQMLFSEAGQEKRQEQEPVAQSEEDLIKVEGHTKKKPGRKGIVDNLPREERIIDLPTDQKICSIHPGTELVQMGAESSESIEYIPSSSKVIVTVRPKYICPCCKQAKDNPEIKIAELPARMIPQSIASPSLLTQIVISKFVDHLPLYRQQTIFLRDGIELSRTTMGEWIFKIADGLQPILNLLEERTLQSHCLSCDETPIRVLTEDGKPIKSLHYFWLRGTSSEFGVPIYLFEYANTRGAVVAKKLLDNFEGFLQVDEYPGYNFSEKTGKIIRIGCWAHVKRKYFEIWKSSKTKSPILGKMLSLISKLYAGDKEAQKEPPDRRTKFRQEKLGPIYDQIHAMLKDEYQKILPQSGTGKAIAYTLNAWEHLENILKDHRLKLDNNFAENAIRPLALGRKNYLFCATNEGARASAALYSILATAKANGLNIREYLNLLFEKLPQAKSLEDFEALLPIKV